MRNGWPSLTAMAVAFGRGLGTEGAAPDPVAMRLLPHPVAAALRATQRLDGEQLPARVVVRGLSLGMVDHVCLRTAAIDDALRTAVAQGVRQLVILGAGLDARAYRMDELANVAVFEVDHPATQAGKREGVAALAPAAAAVKFVAVDFERQRVGDRLDEEGHIAAQPTAWIWEGVTPYLRPAAIRSTIAEIGTRSSAGSWLMMTYVVPEIVAWPLPGARAVARLAFRSLGEPLLGQMTTGAAADLVSEIGFTVRRDGDARQWAIFAPGSPRLALPFRAERLVVAHREPSSPGL